MGVPVPAPLSRPLTPLEQACTLAPPPFSVDRRLQHDSYQGNSEPPSGQKSTENLRQMARERSVYIKPNMDKKHIISKLRGADRADLKMYQTWLSEAEVWYKI